MKALNIAVIGLCLTFASTLNHADAQRRGGGGGRGGGGSRGGGGMSRGGARSSVTSRPSRPSGSFSRPSAPATRPSAPTSRPSAPLASRPSGGQLGNRPNANPPASLGSGGAGNRGDRTGNRPSGDRGNLGNRTDNRPAGDRTNIGSGNNVDRPINIQDNDIVAGGGDWGYNHGCCYGWGAAAAGFVAGAAIGSMVYSLPPACPAYVYSGLTYNHCGGVWYAPQFEGTETTYIVVETPPGAPPDTAAPPPPPAPPK